MDSLTVFGRVFYQVGDFQLTVGQLITAVLVLIASIYLSRFVRSAITRIARLRNNNHQAPQIYTLNRFLHYLILFAAGLVALSILGVDMGKLAFVAGALGIGVGLGLQGLVNNFVSGIVILLEKSLKVGDFVELGDKVFGVVTEINFRSTNIRTNDNVDILVPNADLVTNKVINWTLEEGQCRFRVSFSVAYGSDKELVKKAVLEAAYTVAHTLIGEKYKTSVWMTGFGDSSLEFMLGVWVDYEAVIRPATLRSDYLWAIDDAFRKYHIEIPFPQRDVYIKKHAAIEKSQP